MQSSAGSPAAATTAAIHDFACLFTHDLVRKQKRWQDGRLKYHTHNNRIVVHDDRGNSVGDHHWVSDYAFDEGEEFRLDRGSVIVQVNECVGTRLQDLSELVDKRAKEREERRSAALSKKPVMPRPAASGLPTPNRSLHQPSSFKPLQQVVGTPTGHHGRALIPTESPFEQRQKQTSAANDESSPPAKRRRQAPSPPSKKGYAQSLFGAALSLSSQPQSSAPLRVRHVNTSAARQYPPPTFPSSPPVEPEKPTANIREQSQHIKAPIKPIATGSMSAQARGALPSLLSNRPHEMPVSVPRKKAQPRKLLITQENDEDIPAERPKKSRAKSSEQRLVNLHQTLDRISTRDKQETRSYENEEVVHIQSSNESRPQPAIVAQKSKKREKKTKSVADLVQDNSVIEIQSGDESYQQPIMSSHKAKKREKKSKTVAVPAEDEVPEINDDSAAERPRPGQRKKTSQALEEPSPPALAIEDDQARTELRIKPRKKRGLLMLSRESSNTSKPVKPKEIDPFEDLVGVKGQQVGERPVRKPSPPLERAAGTKTRRTVNPIKATPFLQSEDDEPFAMDKGDDTTASRKSQKASEKTSASTRKRDRSAARVSAEHEAEPGDLSASEEVPKNKKRRKAAQKPTSLKDASGGLSGAEDASFDLLDETDRDMQRPSEYASTTEKIKSTSGPRLARFARKDIRSKEIIGFDFEDEDNVSNFNSFTAASFGSHVIATTVVTGCASETPNAEGTGVPSLGEGNDVTGTTENHSAPLPNAAVERPRGTIISSLAAALSTGIQEQQTAASSPATDTNSMEKISSATKENPQTASKSTKIDARIFTETSAGQSEVVGDRTAGNMDTAIVARVEEIVLDNPAQSAKQRNAASSLCKKNDIRTPAMIASEDENPMAMANNKRNTQADDKAMKVDAQSQEERSGTRLKLGKNQDSGPGARLSSRDATNLVPSLRTESVDHKCLITSSPAQHTESKSQYAQDENITVVSPSGGNGKGYNEATKTFVQPAQKEVTLSIVTDQQPTPEPMEDTGKDNPETAENASPALSAAIQPRTRTFSRAKSMSTAEAGTTKYRTPTLSRQSSAAAKIATADSKPTASTSEAAMTSKKPFLLRQTPAAGEDAIEDKPTISMARLVNPATRGRKAAKPSDAAGQAPQCPLPPESLVSTVSGLGRLRSANARPFKSPATVPVSRSTPLPGPAPAFTTASGDPWSREAFDLFEYQRPS